MEIICKFNHIHLRSIDPASAARFYAEAFGAREVRRTEVGGALRIVLDLDGVRLFFDEVPKNTVRSPQPPFIGIEHIALTVGNLDAAVAYLHACGVRVVTEPKETKLGVRIAFIEGPDGVPIELIEISAA